MPRDPVKFDIETMQVVVSTVGRPVAYEDMLVSTRPIQRQSLKPSGPVGACANAPEKEPLLPKLRQGLMKVLEPYLERTKDVKEEIEDNRC